MGTVNFKTTKEETRLVSQIVKRAVSLSLIKKDALGLHMDITACHKNGNPLKLEELLNVDDFNFCHDIVGIMNTIDRNTGKLTNCFVPRLSK